jgi:hypothetical protein
MISEVNMRPSAKTFREDFVTNFRYENIVGADRADPFKSGKKHQLCVKRRRIPWAYFVVFTQQNCGFHTSLNFSRWIRCASIPRVLSAPAPGVTA